MYLITFSADPLDDSPQKCCFSLKVLGNLSRQYVGLIISTGSIFKWHSKASGAFTSCRNAYKSTLSP